jgi:hypothetical protein
LCDIIEAIDIEFEISICTGKCSYGIIIWFRDILGLRSHGTVLATGHGKK